MHRRMKFSSPRAGKSDRILRVNRTLLSAVRNLNEANMMPILAGLIRCKSLTVGDNVILLMYNDLR